MVMYLGVAAGGHQGARCRNQYLLRTACGSMEDVIYLSSQQLECQPWHTKLLNGKADVESELAQRKSYVKWNSGLSPNFKCSAVGFAQCKAQKKATSQKVKSPIVQLVSLTEAVSCGILEILFGVGRSLCVMFCLYYS